MGKHSLYHMLDGRNDQLITSIEASDDREAILLSGRYGDDVYVVDSTWCEVAVEG